MTEEQQQPDVEPAETPVSTSSTSEEAGSVDGAEVEESLDEAADAAEAVEDATSEDSTSGSPLSPEEQVAAMTDEEIEAYDFKAKIQELTGDVQRLQAEYVNYRKRVERDRELVAQNATYKVLAPIVEVLDTIDRAREHGEVEGGFKAVADQLERIVSSLGLSKFGAPGEPFDPQLHEALSHLGTDPEVQVTTVKVIAKAGYRIGDRVVRAAQVLVVDPE